MACRGIDTPLAAGSVAVLADVHGNAVALEAVSEEILGVGPDAIIFLGDLTCGPLPEETWEVVGVLCANLEGAARFVRGNTERAMIEAVSKLDEAPDEVSERERWLLGAHTARTLAAIESFGPVDIIQIAGLGAVRFCHGSPRSDEEMITSATPRRRMQELSAEIDERVLVSAHTHIQFDRTVAGIRSINPGSVGLPYEGERGAFWALLSTEVELRHTAYDVELAVSRFRATTDPFAEAIVEMLLTPPTREQVIAHAEALVFSS